MLSDLQVPGVDEHFYDERLGVKALERISEDLLPQGEQERRRCIKTYSLLVIRKS